MATVTVDVTAERFGGKIIRDIEALRSAIQESQAEPSDNLILNFAGIDHVPTTTYSVLFYHLSRADDHGGSVRIVAGDKLRAYLHDEGLEEQLGLYYRSESEAHRINSLTLARKVRTFIAKQPRGLDDLLNALKGDVMEYIVTPDKLDEYIGPYTVSSDDVERTPWPSNALQITFTSPRLLHTPLIVGNAIGDVQRLHRLTLLHWQFPDEEMVFDVPVTREYMVFDETDLGPKSPPIVSACSFFVAKDRRLLPFEWMPALPKHPHHERWTKVFAARSDEQARSDYAYWARQLAHVIAFVSAQPSEAK